jgi:hypothetical protein
MPFSESKRRGVEQAIAFASPDAMLGETVAAGPPGRHLRNQSSSRDQPAVKHSIIEPLREPYCG